jgi:hypothetical protein
MERLTTDVLLLDVRLFGWLGSAMAFETTPLLVGAASHHSMGHDRYFLASALEIGAR